MTAAGRDPARLPRLVAATRRPLRGHLAPILGASVLLAGASWVAACGAHGSAPLTTADRACEQAGDDSVIAAALTGFVNRSDPEPGFLVYIPSTDSTPPPAAVQKMENRRTTYMYSTDPKLQTQVENKIKSYGDYDALLIAYHGIAKPDPLHPVVTFSGHYIGGTKVRGRTVGPFQIRPQCDSTGSWTVPTTPGAAPAPAAPAAAGSSSRAGGASSARAG